MSVVILSKRQKKAQEAFRAQGHTIIDVTSNSDCETFVKCSPFWPHGDIPVPGMPKGTFAESVEGIWQGLKVFEKEGVDERKFNNRSMKNIKRATGDKRGGVKGHMYKGRLLTYVEARKKIYLPIYNFVIEHKLQNEIALLKGMVAEGKTVVLLDYETNEDIKDTSKPLSHASLIKKAILE